MSQIHEIMLDQIGRGITGGLMYTGVKKILTDKNNPNMIMLVTNSAHNRQLWAVEVTYNEGSDMYDCKAVRVIKRTGERIIDDECNDIFCDELQTIVEVFYDNMLRDYEGRERIDYLVKR